MAVDPVPYFIGIEGVRHSGEVVRHALYTSTGGAEGVSSPGALKVTASPAADKFIRIAPGGGLLVSKYAGASEQSYAARNASESAIEVPATGSGGGRTDVVIMRILDPQYEGQMPVGLEELNAFQYVRLELIQGVADTVQTAKDLNLSYPAIALARIKRPLNKTIVENADITNLRELAQPRSLRRIISINPTANHPVPTAGYSSWPILAAQRPLISIPSWATVLKIVGHYGGIEFIEPADAVGNTVVGIRTGFGAEGAENGIIVENTPGRGHYTVSGVHAVPLNVRGTKQLINVQATRSAGTGTLEADYQSQIILDVELTEETI